MRRSSLLVLTTVPALKNARALAAVILDQKAGACVTISSASESHYRWQGKRCRSRELLILIKTSAAAYPRLQKIIQKHHPYEVPEIVALPVVQGSSDYLKWVLAESKR